MTDKPKSPQNGWRLSRSIPLSAAIAIIAYAFIATWWTARLSADVAQNKQTNAGRASHSLRLGILEERYRFIYRALQEIKDDVKALRNKP